MSANAKARQRLGAESEISLVKDDLLFRLPKAVGLIPAQGTGVVRRALFFSLLAWLPMAVWAALANRAFPGQIAEPLTAHFGIHAQFLIALPVLILGEVLAHGITTRLVPQFVHSGLVLETEVPRFKEIVGSVLRLRNATAVWLVIGAIVVAWFFLTQTTRQGHELLWAEGTSAGVGPKPTLGFGGWWYIYVGRPIFQIFCFAWLWRLVLLSVLLFRLSKLDLQIAPLHPDRLGGLAFIEGFPRMFSPLAFALSAVLASHWAHEVAYHGAHVTAYKLQAAVFVLAMVLICVSPLAVFVPCLARVRGRALLEYGALVGEHHRLVHRRWIEGEQVPDSTILQAPELGATADVTTLYPKVSRMRTLPIGKQVLIGIVVPVLIPMLVVSAMDVPIAELRGKIVKTLL